MRNKLFYIFIEWKCKGFLLTVAEFNPRVKLGRYDATVQDSSMFSKIAVANEMCYCVSDLFVCMFDGFFRVGDCC